VEEDIPSRHREQIGHLAVVHVIEIAPSQVVSNSMCQFGSSTVTPRNTTTHIRRTAEPSATTPSDIRPSSEPISAGSGRGSNPL